MARLFTGGAEIDILAADVNATSQAGDATVSRDLSEFRSGVASYLASSSGGANPATFTFSNFTPVASTSYFIRAYFSWSGNPSNATDVLWVGQGVTAQVCSVRFVFATRTLQLRDLTGAGSQIGSDSEVLDLNFGVAWPRLELKLDYNASAQLATVTLLLDGISIATGNINTPATTQGFSGGIRTAAGANFGVALDDVALNDSTGANQNTYPGEGKVVLLKPTADSAVGTGWTLGTGTAIAANSGSTAVKNIPPVGVADLTAGSDTKQIRNATSNANVNYDATMTAYAAAGLSQYDVVTVVDPIIVTAAPVTTSSKQGTVGVVSNPTIANIALGAGGTAGAFWSGVAGGTYPTGWKISHGTITYSPAVTISTAPVMRVTQVTASTRIAVVCFMGIYVEYVPHTRPSSFARSDAQHRASNW